MSISMKEWTKQALTGHTGETDDEDEQHGWLTFQIDIKYTVFSVILSKTIRKYVRLHTTMRNLASYKNGLVST